MENVGMIADAARWKRAPQELPTRCVCFFAQVPDVEPDEN